MSMRTSLWLYTFVLRVTTFVCMAIMMHYLPLYLHLHALNMNGEVIYSWSCVSTMRQATCSSICQLKQTSGEKELSCSIPLSLHFIWELEVAIYIVHLPGYLYLYYYLCWVMGVAFEMWWNSRKDDTASHIGNRPPGITALCHQSLSSCCAEQELSTHTVQCVDT